MWGCLCHFAWQNGPFLKAIWPVWRRDGGRFECQLAQAG
nr:MAG TPA: hypothetical protein [Caudoviricetes sp.]